MTGMETDRLSLQLCQISVLMVNPCKFHFLVLQIASTLTLPLWFPFGKVKLNLVKLIIVHNGNLKG